MTQEDLTPENLAVLERVYGPNWWIESPEPINRLMEAVREEERSRIASEGLPGAALDAHEALTTLCEWFGQREAGEPTTNSEAAMFQRVSNVSARLEGVFDLIPEGERSKGWQPIETAIADLEREYAAQVEYAAHGADQPGEASFASGFASGLRRAIRAFQPLPAPPQVKGVGDEG